MAWRFARPVVQLGVAVASKLDWPRSMLEPMISSTPLASRSVFPGSMSSPVPLLSLAATIEMRLGSRVTVEGEIGRGGMSRVYVARRTDSNQRIAVKVMVNRMNGSMTSDQPGLEERFLLEMRILQKLSHPNIPAVLEAGEANGMLFFTMPFIEGGSLRARLRAEGKLPIRDALMITRDAADALAHAHVNGVIHRDVKPDNLLLSPTGAVLLDFGIARAPSLAPPNSVEKPGYVMGTAEYTSPERVSGRRPEDARSDLFSLGCVLYEMLAGKTPFPGGVRQLMKEAGADLSPNMDALPANLPDDVIGVLRRSLAAYPSDRFATARAMSAALTTSIEKLADAA